MAQQRHSEVNVPRKDSKKGDFDHIPIVWVIGKNNIHLY